MTPSTVSSAISLHNGASNGIKLRSLEARWVDVAGEPRLRLRDPLEISGRHALVPASLVPLLPLMDGTRNEAQLATSFGLRTGRALSDDAIAAIMRSLDEAMLLENDRYRAGLEAVRRVYRAQPFRFPALAGRSYPISSSALEDEFEAFSRAAGHIEDLPTLGRLTRAAGVLSPHIDYTRGGPLYAATWQSAAAAVASAEVVVIFGTDHWGSAGRLTLTPQRYATPWGALPTDPDLVQVLAEALGESAFEEELHHRNEHAIELAAVWLHWTLRQAGVIDGCLPPVIPILCGSFHCYTHVSDDESSTTRSARNEGQTPEEEPWASSALDALVQSLGDRRVFVVSAADLAHVGPAFGDPNPLTVQEKEALVAADAALLRTMTDGDAGALLATLRAQQDRNRICGLPPTYWAMRLLERLNGRRPAGQLTGYDQCPADEQFGSVVSIAGVVWE
ncbi:MAG TPA: AmmeMemoRadiSam system protein B [Chloroflexota bacterium]|nr:AmmeMemoRadiSam system protein B [Chloroflexota bacterium]